MQLITLAVHNDVYYGHHKVNHRTSPLQLKTACYIAISQL